VTVTLDYLWLDVELDGDPRVLSLLQNSSTSSLPFREHVWIGVTSTESGTTVEVGDDSAPAADTIAIGELAYAAVHDRVAHWAREEGWSRIHAGLADIGGKRIMIAGPSGVGKTTTIVALADEGAVVLGDEAVMVRDGQAIALPRPFHAKQGGSGIEGLRPEVVLSVLDYPDPIAVLDPAALNRVERLRHEPAPIDLIVLLERGAGAEPVAEPVGVTEAIVALAPDAGPFTPDRADLLRSIIALAESAPVVRLLMTTPTATAQAIVGLA
jgi:hypothetical protein